MPLWWKKTPKNDVTVDNKQILIILLAGKCNLKFLKMIFETFNEFIGRNICV